MWVPHSCCHQATLRSLAYDRIHILRPRFPALLGGWGAGGQWDPGRGVGEDSGKAGTGII